MRPRPVGRAMLALFALLLAAAGADSARAATAEVRVFHGHPGAGPLDLQVDGALRLRRVAEGTATVYLRLPSGRHTLVVRRSTGGRRALARLRVVLRAGRAHTVAATGRPGQPRLRLLVDDRRRLRRAPRLRLVHLLPGGPALRLGYPEDGTTAVRRLAYGAASPHRRVADTALYGAELPIELRDAAAERTMVRAALGLRRGRVYSLFVIPARPRGPLRLVLAQDA